MSKHPKRFKSPLEADEIKIILNEDGTLEFPNYSAWHDFFTGDLKDFRVKYSKGVPYFDPYKEAVWCG